MKLKDDKRRLIIKGKEGKDYRFVNKFFSLCGRKCIWFSDSVKIEDVC